jgi:hypothetical protein
MNYSQWRAAGNQIYAMWPFLPRRVMGAFRSYLQSWREDRLRDLVAAIPANRDDFARRSSPQKLVLYCLTEWCAAQHEQLVKDEEAQCPAYLKSASSRILKAYGDLLDPDYCYALRYTFYEPREHIYCYACYHTEEDWAQRLYELGITGQSNVDDTKGYTGAVHGPIRYNVKCLHPPEVRRIEFPHDANESTVVHEMLHWCCHEEFSQGKFWQAMPKDDVTDVREGITEYLARKAIGDAGGGYVSLMKRVNAVLDGDDEFQGKLFAAYFRGIDAKDVVGRFARALKGESDLRGKRESLRELERLWNLLYKRGWLNAESTETPEKKKEREEGTRKICATMRIHVEAGNLTRGEILSVVKDGAWANFLSGVSGA